FQLLKFCSSSLKIVSRNVGVPVFVLIPIIFLASCSQKARIVLMPDTQYYADKYPEIVHAQTDWIVENSSGIDLVLQQGDLTDKNTEAEWKVIQAAFAKLDSKVPYVLAVGNHDMGSAPGKIADNRDTRLFNTWF